MKPSGEEIFIAEHLAPLSDGFPGAFGLTDDGAELSPLPGHALVFKTDPIVEGVHFFADDAPEDLGWKALAVNVSDLAAKGARPTAYLMALTLPEKPAPAWITRFASGLREAQDAFGCVLIGGDTDQRDGPLSIAVTAIGEVRAGRMVQRAGARVGDLVYVTGELGGAALGLQLRLDPAFGRGWPLGETERQAALQRYLRPEPQIGLRAALQAYARSAMDISDGLIKDLDRMCRLTYVGADLQLEELPMAPGLSAGMVADRSGALQVLSAGDDYEILTTVPPASVEAFETMARRGGVPIRRIGRITASPVVRLVDSAGRVIEADSRGYDHFDRNPGN